MNHHERDGVLPIAFSFSHYIQAQDQSISVIFGKHPPLWATGGWAAKVGVAIDALGRGGDRGSDAEPAPFKP